MNETENRKALRQKKNTANRQQERDYPQPYSAKEMRPEGPSLLIQLPLIAPGR